MQDVGFSAISRAYAGRLSLVDIVKGLAPAETKVSTGHLVLAVVSDTPDRATFRKRAIPQ